MSSENVSLLENGNNPSPCFGLKVGRRFGKDIESLKSDEKTFPKFFYGLKVGGTDPQLGILYERLLSQHI